MNCQILTYNVHGLPWARDCSREICEWIATRTPEIVCLQEVFLNRMRTFYTEHLTRAGYTVIRPRDEDVSILPSGLLMAVRNYKVVSDCFYPYLTTHNVEWIANKGFHAVHLRRACGNDITIVNTHTQADTEVSFLMGGKPAMDAIRKEQLGQIVRHTDHIQHPVLVVGDLNCENSPHPHVRFLHPDMDVHIRKATFYHTGENLDHVAWLPLQYAPQNCTFCDIVRQGPRLVTCQVFERSWSDHAPVLCNIYVPLLRLKKPGGINKERK